MRLLAAANGRKGENVKKIILLSIMFLCLNACLAILTIKVEDANTLFPLFNFGREINASELIVVKVGEAETILWKIELGNSPNSDAGEEKSLSEVKYGTAPEGFKTVVKPSALEWNNSYIVLVSTQMGNSGGIAYGKGEFVLSK
jgi:hypothetical protein